MPGLWIGFLTLLSFFSHFFFTARNQFSHKVLTRVFTIHFSAIMSWAYVRGPMGEGGYPPLNCCGVGGWSPPSARILGPAAAAGGGTPPAFKAWCCGAGGLPSLGQFSNCCRGAEGGTPPLLRRRRNPPPRLKLNCCCGGGGVTPPRTKRLYCCCCCCGGGTCYYGFERDAPVNHYHCHHVASIQRPRKPMT